MKVQLNMTPAIISLEYSEVHELCKPGQGEKTCVWLTMGKEGYECMYKNKPKSLIKAFREGNTISKQNGCDFMKELRSITITIGVPGIEYAEAQQSGPEEGDKPPS